LPKTIPESNTDTLKLITRGRKTGLPHIVKLRFAVQDGFIYILAGSKRSDWVLNVIKSGTVQVKSGEFIYEAGVYVGSKELALKLFNEKYGESLTSKWYADSELCLRLKPISRRYTVRGEGASRTTFSTWRTNNLDYYSTIADAFDSASEEYDYTISHNYINSWIRKKSVSEVLKLVNRDSILLEIGCGTGEEALKIAKYAKLVVATDISSRMIELLTLKVKAKKMEGKVIPLRLAASKIENVRKLTGIEKFDLAYSFNGCLNCEPNLGIFSESLGRLLKPYSCFICSIRNPVCSSEMLSHLFTFQLKKATSRKNQPTMVSVGGKDIPAFYYTPNEFIHYFQHLFRIRRFFALPAILPPAYLSDYYLKMGPLTRLAEYIDKLFCSIPPFNMLGDQTLFIFEKI